MRMSKVIHLVRILVGIAGAFYLFSARAAGENGRFFGYSGGQQFHGAIVLLLIAVAAGVCTLVWINLELSSPVSLPIL
jgi:hypothetical protein